MKPSRTTKQSPEVPWTFVASAKRAKPRLVLTSRITDGAQRLQPKRASGTPDVSQLGIRLEQAFIKAVRTAKKRSAAGKT